jgi:type IV secretion system protein VirB1
MSGVTALILACGAAIHADLLGAVALVESGGNPLALAINGSVELVRPPRDRADAVAMASWLAAHGYNFDAGLAQVNSANFARLGVDTSTVFEPCVNLRAAAKILGACRKRAREHGLSGARAIAAALSCYNTGHLSSRAATSYVTAVRAVLARSSSRAGASQQRPADLTSSTFPTASRQAEAFALASREAFARSSSTREG